MRGYPNHLCGSPWKYDLCAYEKSRDLSDNWTHKWRKSPWYMTGNTPRRQMLWSPRLKILVLTGKTEDEFTERGHHTRFIFKSCWVFGSGYELYSNLLSKVKSQFSSAIRTQGKMRGEATERKSSRLFDTEGQLGSWSVLYNQEELKLYTSAFSAIWVNHHGCQNSALIKFNCHV